MKISAKNQSELNFYKQCAQVVCQVVKHKRPLNLLLSKTKNSKSIYSIATKTIKNKEMYEKIIKDLSFNSKDKYLSLIYVNEIVNNRFFIDNYVTKCVVKKYRELVHAIENQKKYIRLNTLIAEENDIFSIEEEILKSFIASKSQIKEDSANDVLQNQEMKNIDIADKLDRNCENDTEKTSKNDLGDDILDHGDSETKSESSLHKIAEIIAKHDDESSISPKNYSTEFNDGCQYKDLNFAKECTSSAQKYQLPKKYSFQEGSTGENESNRPQIIQNEILAKTSVENVYKVTVNTDLTKIEAYTSGKFIIQHLSSCLPAFILNPTENSIVVDACAAPGNKTSHLAAIMKNTGKIFAFEKNKERFSLLKTMMNKYNVKNAELTNTDFTKVEPFECDYILVDPSCSSSGLHAPAESKDSSRLRKLQIFQTKILEHALKFQNVKAIVYSTCSVHEEENESVVDGVLAKNDNFETQKIEMEGYGRGKRGYKCAEHVIRTQYAPDEDSHGFFVALIVPKNDI